MISLKEIKNNFKDRRNSDSLLWKLFFIVKDFIFKNNFLKYILALPMFAFYYLLLSFKKYKKDEDKKEKVVAIVLSWKRTINMPLVVHGLKKQSFIDDIVVVHNKPSWLRVPGCKNIFNKENLGCIVRHKIAAEMKDYDYFVFCDDDLMLKKDLSKEALPVMRKFGQESVVGLFGHELNIDNLEKAYTLGEYKTSYKNFEPVDIVKGRFHIISKKGIEVLANSDLDTPALISEDDIRANMALQREFKKPSYLIPIKNRDFSELSEFFALQKRKKHKSIRDEAINDAIDKGWIPLNNMKNYQNE